MPVPSLLTLIVQETRDAILSAGLSVAQSLGLPVTSWRAGDPARALFHYEAFVLEKLEVMASGYAKSASLDYAEGEWLEVKAEQDFGVTVPDATYATTDIILTNNGGGLYTGLLPGDLTFRNTSTGRTYRNETGGDLLAWDGLEATPKPTLTLTVVADDAGSVSNAAAGEITEMVTTRTGVTCTNPAPAMGQDRQSPETTRIQCRDKLSAKSPTGPRGAYSYVARNQELTGASIVPKVKEFPDSEDGDVVLYVASDAGPVTAGDLTLIRDAIVYKATPLTITPIVLAATPVTVPVTYEVWTYSTVNRTVDEMKEDIEAALLSLFAALPIGGDDGGKLYKSALEAVIGRTHEPTFRVSVTLPTDDVTLADGEVAVLGTLTATINLVTP